MPPGEDAERELIEHSTHADQRASSHERSPASLVPEAGSKPVQTRLFWSTKGGVDGRTNRLVADPRHLRWARIRCPHPVDHSDRRTGSVAGRVPDRRRGGRGRTTTKVVPLVAAQERPWKAPAPGSRAGATRPCRSSLRPRRVARELAQALERPAQKPRHLHLRDPDALGYLRLGEIFSEPQEQDLALALG